LFGFCDVVGRKCDAFVIFHFFFSVTEYLTTAALLGATQPRVWSMTTVMFQNAKVSLVVDSPDYDHHHHHHDDDDDNDDDDDDDDNDNDDDDDDDDG
jgi:hypothetical protein